MGLVTKPANPTKVDNFIYESIKSAKLHGETKTITKPDSRTKPFGIKLDSYDQEIETRILKSNTFEKNEPLLSVY